MHAVSATLCALLLASTGSAADSTYTGKLTDSPCEFAVDLRYTQTAEGSVSIEGRPTPVTFSFNCRSSTVNLRHACIGVDSDGDGKIDKDRLSPEFACADDEDLVFRAGSTYVSAESLDLRTGRFVLRRRPAADYQRIELAPGVAMPDFTFLDLAGSPAPPQ